MDQYSMEEWLRGRHEAMIRSAETRARLEGWVPRERLAHVTAAHLRRLADRLDGGVQVRPRLVKGG
jgi:hypothetical protein